eukprot:c9827_g2_i2.p1 GENE.c9827_g2_i2~~c9827_g2_i2.p1  ORF type:complete len:166 (-),score=24.95 c9827_g2_i2:410-907(-)
MILWEEIGTNQWCLINSDSEDANDTTAITKLPVNKAQFWSDVNDKLSTICRGFCCIRSEVNTCTSRDGEIYDRFNRSINLRASLGDQVVVACGAENSGSWQTISDLTDKEIDRNLVIIIEVESKGRKLHGTVCELSLLFACKCKRVRCGIRCMGFVLHTIIKMRL